MNATDTVSGVRGVDGGMASRRRGGQGAAPDQKIASLTQSLFPDEDIEQPSHSASGDSPEWKAPPARPYLLPDQAPEPMTAPDAMDDSDLPYWLALNRVKGIGPARFALLLDTFGSVRAAWEATPADWRHAGLDERTTTALERQRRGIVPEAELERLHTLRVGALRVIDDGYPRLLREIPAPPPVLYVRGRLTPDDELALGVVGTR